MKISILALVLLIIAIVTYYIVPIIRSIHMSKKIEENTKPFTQINKDASFRILVTGDSTAMGVGAKNTQDSVAGRFAKDYPESEIINLSENGLKIHGLRQKLETHLQKNKYDYIHIQIGANDVVFLSKYGEIENDLIAILDLVTEKADYVTVLTAADIGQVKVFKYPISKFVTDRTFEVRNIFKETIREYKNVSYIDLYADKELSQQFQKNPEKYYAADMFHLNGKGYGEWYNAIRETLNK